MLLMILSYDKSNKQRINCNLISLKMEKKKIMVEVHVAMNDVKSLETYILNETVRVKTAHIITLNKTNCDKQMQA